MTMAHEVQDNPDRSRYELRVDGTVAAFVTYTRHGDTTTFVHTETEDGYEHQGLAGELVRAALDDTRRRGRRVIARCPYVVKFLDEHHEYDDLLAEAPRRS
jgi:predicted GNAT family acetyltransferase